jgi:hypothetical protein
MICAALAIPPALFAQPQKPKVRAITAFVRIDRANYKSQFGDALKMLRHAKSAMERGGYEVQTIRLVTQPFPGYTRGLSRDEAVAFFREFESLAVKEGVNLNIGPAVLSAKDSVASIELLTEILVGAKDLNASAIIADDDGIHWDAIRATAKLLKQLADRSPRSQATFNFAATAMLAPYAPFYPGAYHTGAGRQFTVGTEGANVVEEVFHSTGYNPALAEERLAKAFTAHGTAIEKIATSAAKETGWTYLGIDITPAPNINVSIGAAIEAFTGARFGSSGTLTASAIITRALRAAPVKHIGYSGLMLPILEDARLAQRWSEGMITVDSLLAYSAVCGTGLDTVPLPGDVTEEQLARILGDVASLAVKWKKPLTARLQPVHGKTVAERSDFDDPFLVNAVLQRLP